MVITVAAIAAAMARAWFAEWLYPPRVHAEETNFDFGVAARGTKGTHSFSISNTGFGELRLAYRGATNFVVIRDWKHAELNCGEAKAISVEYRIPPYHQDKAYEQRIEMETNDREKPRLYFVVRGRVAD